LIRLVFGHGFTDRDEYEAKMRGYLSHARVQLSDGNEFSVFFIDPVRLQQDLEAMASIGRPHFAEVGMIVVPEVTRDAMNNAVADLFARGFFRFFRPLVASDHPEDI
jgi:hypothetical protein